MTSSELFLLFEVFVVSVSLIFWGLIYPIVIISDIIKERSAEAKNIRLRKVLWLFLVFSLGPLTAPIWALLYGSKSWKKWTGFLGYLILIFVSLWFIKMTDETMAQMKLAPNSILSSLQFQDNVSDQIRTQIQQDISALQLELESYGYRDFINLSLDYRLLTLLMKMNEDGLSPAEAQRWISIFEGRKNLDPYTFNPDLEL